jgi:hypothetical protein
VAQRFTEHVTHYAFTDQTEAHENPTKGLIPSPLLSQGNLQLVCRYQSRGYEPFA